MLWLILSLLFEYKGFSFIVRKISSILLQNLIAKYNSGCATSGVLGRIQDCATIGDLGQNGSLCAPKAALLLASGFNDIKWLWYFLHDNKKKR